jgi:hypothetical protein
MRTMSLRRRPQVHFYAYFFEKAHQFFSVSFDSGIVAGSSEFHCQAREFGGRRLCRDSHCYALLRRIHDLTYGHPVLAGSAVCGTNLVWIAAQSYERFAGTRSRDPLRSFDG